MVTSSELSEVVLPRDLIEELFKLAKDNHPYEIFFLLRGKVRGKSVYVEELILPIGTIFGAGFSEFSPHTLPLDPSIVGSLHSHPLGTPSPSVQDLHNFFGIVMIIVAYPYNLASTRAYHKSGRRLKIKVI
ncbi:MAG: Mov34/MPN/PAD-1 family protein [Candidatus Nezhaarchaeota archaeon]|nr:Mov34/MPN/PAD-1 family protein [Candidatus Nezhaarchaeota archaeon]MCX8141445.1 Mov34/MPN/PAD-1 family protein [Candidatus Nezhaarchaeota archaeon]MDW8049711.1 Mov34/MPN/PAD-1 family protein [Nitrososphaerota archaeon]